MALPLDETDFVDREVQDSLAARGLAAANPPAAPGTVAPRPPTREELEARVGEAHNRIAELKRAQDELERERTTLEEARRRRTEFETGRTEMVQHLTRGIGLLEKAEFEARRDAEQLAKTLVDFKKTLTGVQAIHEESWTLDNWTNELTRALTTLENARMEWNAARLKWTLLSGESALPDAPAAGGATQPAGDGLAGRSRGELAWLGLALTWPLAVVALLAFLTLLLVLLRR